MAVEPSGRLELTWTNKHLRLLADQEGGYQWVPPSDYRVAEVRLLHDVEEVGETRGERSRAQDNLLITGDALNALTSLCELPELAREYVGKVKLVYLDPPFNTQQAFEHYDDALEHSVWLTMMRDRLLQIRKLLSPDGSVWVHCDDSEQAYLKVMMDEVYGRDNFVANVIWEKTDSPRMDAQRFSSAHDYMVCYARGSSWEPNRYEAPVDMKDFPHVDEQGRRYSRRELRKWGSNSLRQDRPKLWYPIEAPDGTVAWPIRPDGREGNWRWDEKSVRDEWDRIEWVERSGKLEPYVKTLMEAGKRPRPPKTLWPIQLVGGNPVARSELKALFPAIEPFTTPKPEALLRDVIHIASNPGDIVLDCFAGSGTTAAVAHKMGRRWVAVESSRDTVETFTQPRLEKVVAGDDPGGITEGVGWEGGGGFRVLEVGPSMFAESGGRVWLSEWAANGSLGEATAAQLGFAYEPDAPFAGTKGRARLAVVDGLVNPDVARLLVGALAPEEKLMLCGTAVDPEVTPALRELRPGSRARKIPASILAEYRIAREWR